MLFFGAPAGGSFLRRSDFRQRCDGMLLSDKGMVMEAVNGVIGKLVSLQAVLKEIYDFEQINKRLPLTVVEMRKRIEPWKMELESCRREIVEGKANIRNVEAEIQAQEDKLTVII